MTAMAEIGIDISAQTSKHVSQFREAELDMVVTVCDNAARTCPVWLGAGTLVHAGSPDPASVEGTDEARLAAFRSVRDRLRTWIKDNLRDDGS